MEWLINIFIAIIISIAIAYLYLQHMLKLDPREPPLREFGIRYIGHATGWYINGSSYLFAHCNQHNEPAFIIRVPYYGTIYVLQTLALIRLAERDCGLLYGPLLIGATMRLGNLGNAVGKLYDGWDGFWEEAIERPRAAPDVRDYLGYRTYPRQVDLDSAPAYLGAPGSSTDGKGDQSLCVGAKYRSAYEHAFPIWSESYFQDAPKLIKEY